MSNFLISFAISNFVPTPSVLVTMRGFLKFFGMLEIAPNPPIFLKSLLFFVFKQNMAQID